MSPTWCTHLVHQAACLRQIRLKDCVVEELLELLVREVGPQLLNGVVLEELKTCKVQNANEAPEASPASDMSAVPNERLLL